MVHDLHAVPVRGLRDAPVELGDPLEIRDPHHARVESRGLDQRHAACGVAGAGGVDLGIGQIQQLGISAVAALAGGFPATEGSGFEMSFGTIVGRVTDLGGAGLPNVEVEVTLDVGMRATYSDKRGDYRLAEVDPGSRWVDFTLDGYDEVRARTEVRAGKEARLDVTMQPDPEV